MQRKALYLIPLFSALVWSLNTSLFAPRPDNAGVKLLAHRGVHQIYAGSALDDDTCTANPIETPTHEYIENTIDSMRAAFDSGADVVELDIHLTPDGHFAVFHDWRLECRTDGRGVTEETPMTQLKSLDVGYGYSPDGGQTYPLRGRGVGLIPTVKEVFEALPDGRFLDNFKSRRIDEGEALATLLGDSPTWRAQVFGVYGHDAPTRTVLAQVAGLRGYDKKSLIACWWRYAAVGWTGWVPSACRNTLVVIPINYAHWLWGWPTRFEQRMKNSGSQVILVGPYDGKGFSSGIDSVATATAIPDGFSGSIWTNRIQSARSFLSIANAGPASASRSSRANMIHRYASASGFAGSGVVGITGVCAIRRRGSILNHLNQKDTMTRSETASGAGLPLKRRHDAALCYNPRHGSHFRQNS